MLYLNDARKAVDALTDEAMEQRARAGETILAVDVRGTGQTQQKQADHYCPYPEEWGDAYHAYVLGRSYVGMRAEDVLVCSRYVARRAEGGKDAVQLVAVGNVGIVALHAAALEPNVFAEVRLSRMLASWASMVRERLNRNQAVNVVQGALECYDLPNLATILGNKLTQTEPLNAMGTVVAGE